MTTFAGSRNSSPVALRLLAGAVALREIPAQGYAYLASNPRKLESPHGTPAGHRGGLGAYSSDAGVGVTQCDTADILLLGLNLTPSLWDKDR